MPIAPNEKKTSATIFMAKDNDVIMPLWLPSQEIILSKSSLDIQHTKLRKLAQIRHLAVEENSSRSQIHAGTDPAPG